MNRYCLAALLIAAGCGAGSTDISGAGGGRAGTGGGAGAAGGGGGGTSGGASGGGGAMGCPDADKDGYTTCAGDCNDNDASIHPGATETLNGKDDDCDGIIDNHIAGRDFDMDGTPYPQDCNDNDPLIGPMAIEDPTNKVDDDCDGVIDEPVDVCDGTAGTTADDYAKAIGLCSTAAFPIVTSATFGTGDPTSRSIRAKFGDSFAPREGSKMIMLSTGKAVDKYDDPTYHPQNGFNFGTSQVHPLYSAPRCAVPTATPPANDVSELTLTLKVPQNAKGISFNFTFFSAEYPEWSCTDYNDRFLAILESSALDPTKLTGQCITSATRPTCNISFDSTNQPVSVNNGFFDICVSDSGGAGPTWSNTCTKPTTLLVKTGYEEMLVCGPGSRFAGAMKMAGGATGWLKSTAPVKALETIVLRFIVLDEGDGNLDSSVLIDNLKWELAPVTATPVTVDPGIN